MNNKSDTKDGFAIVLLLITIAILFINISLNIYGIIDRVKMKQNQHAIMEKLRIPHKE